MRIEGTQQAIRSREQGLGFILAFGLLNTLIHAKDENELARRDTLLDELRALARSYPDDAAVRELLLALTRKATPHSPVLKGHLGRSPQRRGREAH
jgi:hypothetical protein